jgi:hypothetical protein
MIEKNIYQKLKSACEEASYVKKGERKAGMPFNPLLADDVKKVAMESLLKNGLYPICNYTTDIRDSFLMINCDMKIVNVDNPNEFIEINGSSGFGKLDKYGTGNGMTYAQKYAFLSALNLKTGIIDEDGYNPEPFKKKIVKDKTFENGHKVNYPKDEPIEDKKSIKQLADEWIEVLKKTATHSASVGKFEQNLNPLRQSYLSDLKQINSDLIQQQRIDQEYISLQKQITNRKK